MNKPIAALMLLASVSTLAACNRRAPEELPPPPRAETTTATPTPSVPRDTGPRVGSQAHFEAAMGGIDATMVFFDTDEFGIDTADQATLRRIAQYFQSNPQLTFTIEGHCDERGTREYNIALGERRANAARNFLVSLGVSPDRIRIVSYGKERPRPGFTGSSPRDWAGNRRAASVVIN